MTSPATSEDLVVVLEQRLETSALLFQPPQGLLLQQPGDLAHREAACGGGGGMKGPEQRNSVTKERQEVYRCDVHQYINTALQACAEIIFTRHDRGRKKHLCLWTDMYTHIYIHNCFKQKILHGQKTPLSLSLSVSQGCEVCPFKAAPTSCQSIQHAFHRCISPPARSRA